MQSSFFGSVNKNPDSGNTGRKEEGFLGGGDRGRKAVWETLRDWYLQLKVSCRGKFGLDFIGSGEPYKASVLRKWREDIMVMKTMTISRAAMPTSSSTARYHFSVPLARPETSAPT